MSMELRRKYNVYIGFYKTWKLLSERQGIGTINEYDIPCIVNGAFACEIGLKYILSCEGIKYGNTHLLHELLSLLPLETYQDFINEIKSRSERYTDEFIKENISTVTNMFEDYRYAYEHKVYHLIPFTDDFFESIYKLVEKYLAEPLETHNGNEIGEEKIKEKLTEIRSEMEKRISRKERMKK